MACDDDCPQYKSASLCSHVVAAALHNEQLTQLVLSDKKVKCTPNLTKLATSEMPKGRGRKGGKAPAIRCQYQLKLGMILIYQVLQAS